MALIVTGLTFGDEGKGSITDFLVREHGAREVVRYNGGPQAGHNVVTDDGRWHCFAQLGAGSFVEDTRTILAPAMLVELENLEVEADVLASKGVADPIARVEIDPACRIVTPMHKMICQMTEVALGSSRKGSCGMGVGEAARDARITAASLIDGTDELDQLAEEGSARADEIAARAPSEEMARIRAHFVERCRPDVLRARYRSILARLSVRSAAETIARGRVVFEGAQGALLDRRGGFFPFVTESRATHHNASAMLGSPATKIGVLRAYAHRHGPGPFVTEDPTLASSLADPYNGENRWQGPFRVGHLDLVAVRYGLALNEGVDSLALTGLDRLSGLPRVRVCTSYVYEGDGADDLDLLFEHEGTRVLAIKGSGRDGELARALSRCRPLEWIEIDGFSDDVRGVRRVTDLPYGARRLIDILEGLGSPVSIVSVRSDAGGKISTASPGD